MGPKEIFLIFSSIQFILAQDESCDGQIIEKQLCMSAGYQNTIAPNNVTKISVYISDIDIIEVNIKEQALTVGFDYFISWIDPRAVLPDLAFFIAKNIAKSQKVSKIVQKWGKIERLINENWHFL